MHRGPGYSGSETVLLFVVCDRFSFARAIIFESQYFIFLLKFPEQKKLHGLSPQANYTDRATAACRRSNANFCG
jgi:hypothetical protein